jgi:hypothetical protein
MIEWLKINIQVLNGKPIENIPSWFQLFYSKLQIHFRNKKVYRVFRTKLSGDKKNLRVKTKQLFYTQKDKRKTLVRVSLLYMSNTVSRTTKRIKSKYSNKTK